MRFPQMGICSCRGGSTAIDRRGTSSRSALAAASASTNLYVQCQSRTVAGRRSPVGRLSMQAHHFCWWPAISSLEAHSNRSLCDQSAHYEAIFEEGSAGTDLSGTDRSIAIIRSTQTPESTNCCAAFRMKAIIIVWGKRVRENPSCDFFRAQPFDIAVVRAADGAHPSSSPSS
jgi:hypothetical protein